jgi:3-oxoacyl-[acyl-carrier protein] reductase
MSDTRDTPVAIITGAGKGIGRATAIELAQRGYQLLLTARTETDLKETIRLAGRGVSLAGDVAEPAHPQRLVDLALDRFGRVDAIVNNAGYAPILTTEEVTPEEFRRIIDVNLTAAFALCRAAWPIMKRLGGGVIVNLSSAASRDPFPGLGVYGAAKAAINLLTLALAREGDPHHIRVHAIAPSATETEMFRAIMTEDQVPTEEIMQPTDVARVIADCVTGRLMYTSGEVIHLHKSA